MIEDQQHFRIEDVASPALAVAPCSLARRVPVEVRAPGFFARWELSPDKLDALLALVGDSILAAQAERANCESAKPESIPHQQRAASAERIQ